MPYDGPNDPSLPSNVKRMPRADRIRWIAIVNQCMADGGTDGECMHKANGVMMMANFGAIATHTGPKADENTSWSAPTLADFTSEQWENLDNAEKSRIAKHFVWSEDGPIPEKFTDLAGPHHEAGKTGVGPVVFKGISSGRMAQASWFNQPGVKAHLAAHYHQFDRKAPWEGSMEHEKNFRNVELFRTGKWTDSSGKTRTWSDTDLSEIVAAYEETKTDVHPPIKLGHDDKQRLLGDEPAAGWIENIKKVGEKLVGDFIKVPDAIAKLIESGAYRTRSVELSPDFEVNGKSYKYLLTGVALLGSRLPAVSGLKDILKLYEADEKSNVFLFQEEEDIDAELQGIFDRLEAYIKNQKGAPHIRALQSALKSAIKQHTRRSDNEMDKTALAKLLSLPEDATEEDIESAIKKLSKASHENPTTTPPVELAEAEKRILNLEQQLAVRDAESIVNDAIKVGKLLPAQKETALKMALRDKDEFTAFVASQPNMVEFGERGSGGGNDINYAKYEPTQEEINVAKSLNVWSESYKITLMRTKAQKDGIELPADFGKVKSE